MLLQMRFDVSEFLQELIMHQNLQILHVIIGLVGPFQLLLRLSWVQSLEDAEPSEIFERELHLPDRLTSCEVLSGFTLSSFLYFLAH